MLVLVYWFNLCTLQLMQYGTKRWKQYSLQKNFPGVTQPDGFILLCLVLWYHGSNWIWIYEIIIYFHCQINHGFSLGVTLVSLLFLWVFRASATRVPRDSVCLFKQTNLGFRPLSPSNAALDQWTIFLLLSLCSCIAEATLWPSPQNQMPKL